MLEHSLSKKAAAARRGAARDVEKILLTAAMSPSSTSAPPLFPSASQLAETDVPGICSALYPLSKSAGSAAVAVQAAAVEAAARLFASWCDGAEEAVLASSSSASAAAEAAETTVAAASALAAAELLATTSLPRALSGQQQQQSKAPSGAPLPCFAERLGKLEEALRGLRSRDGVDDGGE